MSQCSSRLDEDWSMKSAGVIHNGASRVSVGGTHQENSKLLIFYLIRLNPLNLKLSKIREEKRRGLDLFFLLFLNFFLIALKST